MQVSHHVTHLHSAFHPSPFDVAAGIVVDNQGSRARHFTDSVALPDGSSDLLEMGLGGVPVGAAAGRQCLADAGGAVAEADVALAAHDVGELDEPPVLT